MLVGVTVIVSVANFWKIVISNVHYAKTMMQHTGKRLEKRGVFALLSPYERCTASECKCKEGSEHIEEDGNWSIIVCTNCEVKGVHVRCREDNVNPFVCSTCPKNG